MSPSTDDSGGLLRRDRTFDFSAQQQAWLQFRNAMRRDRTFDFMINVKDLELDVSHGPILYIEDLNVSFDGFKAINNLNFYVDAGELRCVIGANGAGKTTMMTSSPARRDRTAAARSSVRRSICSGCRSPRSPRSASAASSRSRPCSSITRCSRTWNWP